MSVVINSHIFEQLQVNLVNLSGAIEHIGYMVGKIDEALPEKAREQLEDKVMGILSLCHCLSTMSLGMSEDAEGFQYWAHKNNVQIIFED